MRKHTDALLTCTLCALVTVPALANPDSFLGEKSSTPGREQSVERVSCEDARKILDRQAEPRPAAKPTTSKKDERSPGRKLVEFLFGPVGRTDGWWR